MIQPVMDASEWATFLDPMNKDWAPLMYHNMSGLHAAATGLYGKHNGFTHEDALQLRQIGADLALDGFPETALSLAGLAARIEALLPPAALPSDGAA